MSESLHIGSAEKTKKIIKHDDGIEKGLMEKIDEWMISISPVNIKSKVAFYRLLATMINAGVSLVKSFTILKDQFDKDLRMKSICKDLLQDLEKGSSLSDALEKYDDVFGSAERSMIASGEVSGRLNDVLLDLSTRIEDSAKIKSKIKGAMMYPIAVVFVLIVVVTAVLILVIPKLKQQFESGGAELPGSTQALIDMSDFIMGSTFGLPNAVLIIGGVIAFVFALKAWKKTKEGKYYWDQFTLAMPVFGGLGRKVILVQFCNSLSSLTNSGISITKALEITSEVVGNEVYRRRIMLIRQDVEQGITMSDNLKEDVKLFPSMLTSMIGVGEQTAQLDKACQKIGAFYADEVDTMVKGLSSLMEPIIILVIGGVVGFMVAAIMTPIMKMSEVSSGG